MLHTYIRMVVVVVVGIEYYYVDIMLTIHYYSVCCSGLGSSVCNLHGSG